MIKDDLKKLLIFQGWNMSECLDCEIWQKGHIIIKIKRDELNEDFIEIPTGDKGYICQIDDVSFTPFRMLIKWNGNEEWFLRY